MSSIYSLILSSQAHAARSTANISLCHIHRTEARKGSVQFSCSVVSDSETQWTAAGHTTLSIINSQSLLKLTSIESVMPSNRFILCHPLLLTPSMFPSPGSFQMSQFFVCGGQSTGISASASVLPMNIQD